MKPDKQDIPTYVQNIPKYAQNTLPIFMILHLYTQPQYTYIKLYIFRLLWI